MDEQENEDLEAKPEDEVQASSKKRKRRRLLLFAALAALCVGGGGAGVFFSGVLDGGDAGQSGEHVEANDDDDHGITASTSPSVFHPLPDLLVTINTEHRRSMFLKVRVTLELEKKSDITVVDQMLPRIVDYCQIYLRELRPDDLAASAGTVRLREELLRRISAAVAPTPVRDVLFSELLIQ